MTQPSSTSVPQTTSTSSIPNTRNQLPTPEPETTPNTMGQPNTSHSASSAPDPSSEFDFSMYEAYSDGAMARFLRAVYGNRELAEQCGLIKFQLPEDGIIESGVVEFLGVDVENLLTEDEGDEDDDGDKEKTTPEQAAEALEMQLVLFGGKLERIPLKTVISMYLLLFSVCPNVETIEVDAEIAAVIDREELGMRFPKLDKDHTEDCCLSGAVVRIGITPEE
ncbi:hypothetical protein BU26DRAFT_570727 [Trematosphaeria pertusa]|uniref:Uncharacterized protein n=1 Tax=Trematosphaeria pertusa TaxID=390896 RepID=A0A6A6HWS9_9PLEO|nr:uncharacterized protein BU26DRAFT_570727 [Trematosphaeria pertusa]KAF2242664.1 hypothetical protein BU26DRAFT_570727 [Trematosphaeria pertusa]